MRGFKLLTSQPRTISTVGVGSTIGRNVMAGLARHEPGVERADTGGGAGQGGEFAAAARIRRAGSSIACPAGSTTPPTLSDG